MFDDNFGVGLILDLYSVVRCKKLFPVPRPRRAVPPIVQRHLSALIWNKFWLPTTATPLAAPLPPIRALPLHRLGLTLFKIQQPLQTDTEYVVQSDLNYISEIKYTIRSIVCEAFCHSVTRSLGHSVTWSLCHLVTWSLGQGHSVTWSPSHSIIWSLGHLVTRPLGH